MVEECAVLQAAVYDPLVYSARWRTAAVHHECLMTSPPRDALWIAGNGKREGGTRAVVRLCPEATVVSLDDGAADKQPDAHAVALRRVEGIEQAIRALAVEARASIPNSHADTIAVLSFGLNQQLPRAIVHVGHRVRGVAKQIQDDLLELNAIAGDGRQIVGKLRLNDRLRFR